MGDWNSAIFYADLFMYNMTMTHAVAYAISLLCKPELFICTTDNISICMALLLEEM